MSIKLYSLIPEVLQCCQNDFKKSIALHRSLKPGVEYIVHVSRRHSRPLNPWFIKMVVQPFLIARRFFWLLTSNTESPCRWRSASLFLLIIAFTSACQEMDFKILFELEPLWIENTNISELVLIKNKCTSPLDNLGNYKAFHHCGVS